MPGGDGTGPMGLGPLTGRGAGFCAEYPVMRYRNRAIGYGMGFGRGRGFKRRFYCVGIPEEAYYAADYGRFEMDEKESLQYQAKFMENQLHEIKKRLDVLDQKDE